MVPNSDDKDGWEMPKTRNALGFKKNQPIVACGILFGGNPLSGVVTTPGYNRATVPLVNSSLFFVQKTAHLRAINRTALAPKVTTIRRLFFGSGDAHRLDELQSYPLCALCQSVLVHGKHPQYQQIEDGSS